MDRAFAGMSYLLILKLLHIKHCVLSIILFIYTRWLFVFARSILSVRYFDKKGHSTSYIS